MCRDYFRCAIYGMGGVGVMFSSHNPLDAGVKHFRCFLVSENVVIAEWHFFMILGWQQAT